MEVSGNRPTPADRQAKLSQPGTKAVGLAIISYPVSNAAACSCGATFIHQRSKVIEDRIDKHITKKHNGRGIRL